MGIVSNYYIVNKNEILEKFSDKKNPIEFLKKSLSIIPKKMGMDEPLPMITYKIIGDNYHIPYKWGIDNFGIDKEDVSEGFSIDVNLRQDFPPRSDQVKLIDDMMAGLRHRHRVLLSAYAATGKTYCAIYAMCQLKVTTAIVVGKGTLIDQWRERLKLFTDLTDDDIGLVKSKSNFTFKNKKVVLISTDSFYNRTFDDEFLRYFGYVIFDEYHNFNAQLKFNAIGKLYARYQLGMSATHDRVDHRDKVSELWFGEISIIATDAEPIPIDVIVIPIYHDTPLNINYDYFKYNNLDPRWSEITKLSKLEFRNKIAAKIINYEYKNNNYILCVSNRTEQIQEMYNLLIDKGIDDSSISMIAKKFYKKTYKMLVNINLSETNKNKYKNIIIDNLDSKFKNIEFKITKNKIIAKNLITKADGYELYNYINRLLEKESETSLVSIDRDSVVKSNDEINKLLNDKSKKIILATYQLLKEGISIWWISRLIDLTPESRAEQLLGRIGRKAEDGGTKIKPICYTLFDYGAIPENIKRVHKKRLSNYKKLKFVNIRKIKSK